MIAAPTPKKLSFSGNKPKFPGLTQQNESQKSEITPWCVVGEVRYAVGQGTELPKKWGRGLERLRDHDDLGLARRAKY